MKRKYIGYFIALFLLAVIFSIVTRQVIESNTPEFITEKFEELKGDKILMDSIGGYKSFEYTFNKKVYKAGKDVKYKILIFGKEKDLRFEGTQTKDQNQNWILSDSKIIIE